MGKQSPPSAYEDLPDYRWEIDLELNKAILCSVADSKPGSTLFDDMLGCIV